MNKDSYDEEYDWNEGVKVEGGGRHEVGRPLAGYRLGHLASSPASVALLGVVPSQVPRKSVGETNSEEACSTSMFLLGRYFQWV